MNDIMMPDVLLFLRAWICHPFRVAAITPSGSALAELITREITPTCGAVLELGPGTGVFTRALLTRGVREEDLTLVENDAEFSELLQRRFPKARLLLIDAARLGQNHLFEGVPIGAVISGLPLLSMAPKQVLAILARAFGVLRHGGAFYQFTYGPRCPISRRLLDRLGLKAICVGRTYFNIPPAAVYRITKRTPSKLMDAWCDSLGGFVDDTTGVSIGGLSQRRQTQGRMVRRSGQPSRLEKPTSSPEDRSRHQSVDVDSRRA